MGAELSAIITFTVFEAAYYSEIMKVMGAELSAIITFTVFEAAYYSEIMRAGIQSVPASQIEAGNSLGFSKLDILRFIVLPQAWRNVLPPMAGQFIQLIKDSSLVSLVSIQELTFSAQDVQVTTQRVFEVFVFVAVVYFILCLSLSRLFAHLERRHARGVNKWFGDHHVLCDIDLSIKRGERMVICGPSGSGKSTLIRCINRLEEHDSGVIVVDKIELNEDTEH
eukprot:gene28132-49940_t